MGEVLATETAIVKRTGNQRSSRTAAGDAFEVGEIAYPAGRQHPASRRPRHQGLQAFEVRPETGADARERHGDDFVRPARGVVEQARRADETITAKVERQHHGPLPQTGSEARRQRFAADDGAAETARLPDAQRRVVGDAGVDPQTQFRETPTDAFDCHEAVALALDRIEVGDVQLGERAEIEQRGDDIDRRAAATERSDERPVIGALAADGADDLTGQEIDNRYQLERQDGTLRIFVYEHITGGGFAGLPLPPSLNEEGSLMLQALVDDLMALADVEVLVTRDPRLPALPAPARTLFVQPGERLEAVLQLGLAAADAIWPVAPESGGVLERISRFVEASGVPLLGSSATAVGIAASKSATARALAGVGLSVVPTYPHPDLVAPEFTTVVIKPDDGAGCLDTRRHTRPSACAWWSEHATTNADGGRPVAQPYIAGEAISLSLLCRAGEAQVLSCNRQHVREVDGVFAFTGVTVNAYPENRARYAALAARIAGALPGLWGYVGIDLIETAEGPMVLEVNPRLTTSYVGLGRALGINPAALALALCRPGGSQAAPVSAGTAIHIGTLHEH